MTSFLIICSFSLVILYWILLCETVWAIYKEQKGFSLKDKWIVYYYWVMMVCCLALGHAW